MNSSEIESLVEKQREFYNSGKTMSLAYRQNALSKLQEALIKCEDRLNDAIYQDLGKSVFESYMCEVGLTLSELSYVKRHFRRWNKNHMVPTPLAQFAAKSFTVKEPYGVVLIMSPWNYPVLLTLEPLIGAIAAGNCCILKPSAYSPATSKVMKEIIEEIFPSEYVAVVEGGRAENTTLLDQKFDYIFFTGGVSVGKLVTTRPGFPVIGRTRRSPTSCMLQ